MKKARTRIIWGIVIVIIAVIVIARIFKKEEPVVPTPDPGDIAVRIRDNLPLGYHALFMPVQVFNGVLQCDDMGVPGAVDFVDDTGQGGAFAAACRSGHPVNSAGNIMMNPLFHLK